MKTIKQNPFRILGIYSNASAGDIAAHLNRAKALANVNQIAEFEEDLKSVLPSVIRDKCSIQDAKNQINLPEDKIKHALFWFCKKTSIDGIALGHLQTGNISKALELFNKQTNFSSLINTGVLLLMQNVQDATGIVSILKVIHNDSYRDEFVHTICGETFKIEEEKLLHIFLDELLLEVSPDVLYNICIEKNVSTLDSDYLKDKAVNEPVSKINENIAEAMSVPQQDALANYRAGVKLVNQTENELAQVQRMLGKEDVKFRGVADNLAKAILQCGINYFNHSTDNNKTKYARALQLQEYALTIAVGSLVKSRCQENVDILYEQKKNSELEDEIGDDLRSVTNALESFQSKFKSIDNAISLVNECKPHLLNIKNKLGNTDDLYLKISSAVANNALGMCVSVVNSAQNNFSGSLDLYGLKSKINSALSAMELIGSLDMVAQERSRFNSNKSTLRSIKIKVDSISIPTSSIPSSDSDTNWGCIIAIIIGIVSLFIAVIAR